MIVNRAMKRHVDHLQEILSSDSASFTSIEYNTVVSELLSIAMLSETYIKEGFQKYGSTPFDWRLFFALGNIDLGISRFLETFEKLAGDDIDADDRDIKEFLEKTSNKELSKSQNDAVQDVIKFYKSVHGGSAPSLDSA